MSNEKREKQMMNAANAYIKEYSFNNGAEVAEAITDFCEGWRAADNSRWIPVEERLPPRAENSFTFSDYVLVCDNIGYMDTACYNFEKNRWDWLNNVTHWMPLPESPRKEE